MKFNFLLALALFSFSRLHAQYVPIEEIIPGQVRFSSKNVELKVASLLKKGDAVYDEETKKYIGKYAHGQSCFSESEALPVVKAPFGYVLVDGHHHTLASLFLGIPEIPIKEIDDLSEEQAFWQEAEKKGYVYLHDSHGKKSIPSSFTHLEEDSNRYFAAITARKYPESKDPTQSIGAEYPLWIKIGKDIPFMEFKISDALTKDGFTYLYEWGAFPPQNKIEEARAILLKAQIPGLRLVETKSHYSEIVLN